jgi:hypothetical protein
MSQYLSRSENNHCTCKIKSKYILKMIQVQPKPEEDKETNSDLMS